LANKKQLFLVFDPSYRAQIFVQRADFHLFWHIVLLKLFGINYFWISKLNF